MKNRISILGAGSWGTTLAVLLGKKEKFPVVLWTPFRDLADTISREGENKTFLPGVRIPPKLLVTSKASIALSAQIIIIAVPVEYLRATLKRIKESKIDLSKKILVSVMKGVEIESLKRPSSIIKEELGVSDQYIAVLSGPTIAKEVAAGVPTVATAASSSHKNAQCIQKLFKDTALRVYTHSDIAAIETAGALKNIIALACGISDGLGFGANTKSALICRGLKEMIRYAKRFKMKEEAFLGTSGIGDLCTTCFSPSSRNHQVGERLGKGEALADILKDMSMVAEGVTTVKAVNTLSKKFKIDMPITKEVYSILYLNKPPLVAVKDLMSRSLKAE